MHIIPHCTHYSQTYAIITDIYPHLLTHTHARTHTHAHARTHTHHTHVRTRTHTHTHTYHTHTHTTHHTHTHTHSAVPIGRINAPSQHTVENTILGMQAITTKIPRGWRNIQSVHLKTVDSIALPLYNSLPPPATLLPDINKQPRGVKRVRLESTEDDDESLLRKRSSWERLPQERVTLTGKKMGSGKLTTLKTKWAKSTQVSAKKIKGSSVISSKYEKALKKHRRTRR